MLMTMAAAALAILAAAPTTHVDTTFAARPGGRLQIENFRGSVTIAGWPRNLVRLEADRSESNRIAVESGENGLVLRSVGRMGPPGNVDYNLHVPRWMEVRISGVFNEASVSGIEAPVRIETVKGDVTVHGGREFLDLETVSGSVVVEGARGKIEVQSVNQGVQLRDVEGEINAESVNGDVELRRVRSSQVECSSVNGSLDYEGEIRDGGHYGFSTHNGSIVVTLPSRPSAAVSVSTFNGEFESTFPVSITRTGRGKQRFTFTLGSGGADIELESFQGSIRLRRAGEGR